MRYKMTRTLRARCHHANTVALSVAAINVTNIGGARDFDGAQFKAAATAVTTRYSRCRHSWQGHDGASRDVVSGACGEIVGGVIVGRGGATICIFYSVVREFTFFVKSLLNGGISLLEGYARHLSISGHLFFHDGSI